MSDLDHDLDWPGIAGEDFKRLLVFAQGFNPVGHETGQLPWESSFGHGQIADSRLVIQAICVDRANHDFVAQDKAHVDGIGGNLYRAVPRSDTG